MNIPLRAYRLSERGGPGLACDENGLALGGVNLARVGRDANGAARGEVRSPGEVGKILRLAYGTLADVEVRRVHRGLCRAAAWIEAGDLGLAGIEAVMPGLPDLAPDAMAKLAVVADLEKGANTAWETEPRMPSGQSGGGQWTTGGGASSTAAPATSPSTQAARPERRSPSQPSTSSSPTRADASARRDAGAVDSTGASLLVPISTATVIAGGRGTVEGFELPEGVARLGRVGLLAYAAGLLDQWGDAAGRDQVTKAIARFGLDPSRPADVIAASAYVWSRYALPRQTAAPFSGPALDAASEAVMRCVLANPGVFATMLEGSTSQKERSASLVIGAANAGLADYAAESRARPAGVAPELQTTSRAARAAISDQLKSGRMEAHHLVPAYNWGQRVDISDLAVKDGWEVNSPSNLIALPADPASQAEYQAKFGEWLPVHRGFHKSYNDETASLILAEETKFPPNPTPLQARAIMDEVARINRIRLMSGYYGPWVKVRT
jgi:hypothetical protein